MGSFADYRGTPGIDLWTRELLAARRALGLDLVAFDYGYTREGEAVVWEANPFPHIQFAKTTTSYRNRAIERSAAAMLKMYLDYARLPVPVEAAVAYA